MAETIDGVKAPSGGFQQGGWYEGRQYWNGTLSAKGVENSQSGTASAGTKVSDEVNRAGSVAAGLAPNAYKDYLSGGSSSANSSNNTQTNTKKLPDYAIFEMKYFYNSKDGWK